MKLRFLSLILYTSITCVYSQPETLSFKFNSTASPNILQKMEKCAKDVFEEINYAYKTNNEPAISTRYATNNARKTIKSLWDISPFYLIEKDYNQSIANISDNQYGCYCIDLITISMKELKPKDQKQSIKIIFNSAGLIADIRIRRAELQQATETFSYISTADSINRKIIENIIEEYRQIYKKNENSAYQFLQDFFSDNALIRTGTTWKKYIDGKTIQITNYKQIDKQTHISNIIKRLKKGEKIDVEFENIEISQSDKNKFFYGVRLRQKYYSKTTDYKDDGFLFILIDLRNNSKPVLWVRTWQNNETPMMEQDNIYNYNI